MLPVFSSFFSPTLSLTCISFSLFPAISLSVGLYSFVSPILSLFLPLYLICLFFVLSPQTLHLCFVSMFSFYLFLSVCCPSHLLPPGDLLSVPTHLIQFDFSLLQSYNYFSFLLFSPTLSMTGSSFPSIFPLSFLLYFTALYLPSDSSQWLAFCFLCIYLSHLLISSYLILFFCFSFCVSSSSTHSLISSVCILPLCLHSYFSS